MAWQILEITKPPIPDPDMAKPTANPLRFENHCWGAPIQGNQTKEAPKPYSRPCVKNTCHTCFILYELLMLDLIHVLGTVPLLQSWLKWVQLYITPCLSKAYSGIPSIGSQFDWSDREWRITQRTMIRPMIACPFDLGIRFPCSNLKRRPS